VFSIVITVLSIGRFNVSRLAFTSIPFSHTVVVLLFKVKVASIHNVHIVVP